MFSRSILWRHLVAALVCVSGLYADKAPASCAVNNPWPEIQEQYKNGVVQVFAQFANFNWLEPYKSPNLAAGGGSGFFINDKGYLITNAHVVSQSVALAVQIPAMGKERLDVEIVAVSFDRDFALLKLKKNAYDKVIKTLGKITYLPLGDSSKTRRADQVMLFGYPLGQESFKTTAGVVSGIEHIDGRQYIQIDAPINPGNSGGPALDTNGTVIGIGTATMHGAQNVTYIIPINELKVVQAQLFSRENSNDKIVRKPLLGIFLHLASDELTEYLKNPAPGGAYVPIVHKGSPADKAGIKKGDMIYEVNGHAIDIYGEMLAPWTNEKIPFLDYLAYVPVGKPVHFVVLRAGKKLEFDVSFTEEYQPAIRYWYPDFEEIDYEVFGGLVIMPVTANHLQIMLPGEPELFAFQSPKKQVEPALVITNVLPDSAAQRSRVLDPGNVIKEFNGTKVKTLEQLRAVIREAADKPFLKIRTRAGIVAVLSMQQILCDEPRLARIHRYPLSQLSKQLLSDAKQKAAGLACPTITPKPEPITRSKSHIAG